MDFFNSTDAKREFGELLVKSQREPIGITRNGKPIAVVMSERDYLELKSLATRASLSGDESNKVTLQDHQVADDNDNLAQKGLGLNVRK